MTNVLRPNRHDAHDLNIVEHDACLGGTSNECTEKTLLTIGHGVCLTVALSRDASASSTPSAPARC
jgi:hypothetical protein